jgi:chromosome segregation ATPase
MPAFEPRVEHLDRRLYALWFRKSRKSLLRLLAQIQLENIEEVRHLEEFYCSKGYYPTVDDLRKELERYRAAAATTSAQTEWVQPVETLRKEIAMTAKQVEALQASSQEKPTPDPGPEASVEALQEKVTELERTVSELKTSLDYLTNKLVPTLLPYPSGPDWVVADGTDKGKQG